MVGTLLHNSWLSPLSQVCISVSGRLFRAIRIRDCHPYFASCLIGVFHKLIQNAVRCVGQILQLRQFLNTSI